MSVAQKIAVFPEPGAMGPLMNLIGICQGLRDLGHHCTFMIDPGLAGAVFDRLAGGSLSTNAHLSATPQRNSTR